MIRSERAGLTSCHVTCICGYLRSILTKPYINLPTPFTAAKDVWNLVGRSMHVPAAPRNNLRLRRGLTWVSGSWHEAACVGAYAPWIGRGLWYISLPSHRIFVPFVTATPIKASLVFSPSPPAVQQLNHLTIRTKYVVTSPFPVPRLSQRRPPIVLILQAPLPRSAYASLEPYAVLGGYSQRHTRFRLMF